MRPPKAFPSGTSERLQVLLKKTKRADERVRIQAVLMRAELSATPAQIAAVTGLALNSVRVLHSRFLREGEACLVGRPGRGGRRHASLTLEQERDFLASYKEPAAAGGVLNLSEVLHATEVRFGRKVSRSALYRMFARNGWRKVVPRPFHPKKAPQSETDFKKSTRKSSGRNTSGRRKNSVRLP